MIRVYLILDFSYCTLAIEVNGALVLYKDIQRDMKLFDNIYAELGELNINELLIIVKTEPVENKVSIANSYGLVNANCNPDIIRAIESLIKQLSVEDYKFVDALSILNTVHNTVVLYKVCGATYAIAVTHAPCAILCLNGDNSRIRNFMNRHGITEIADLSLQEFGGISALNPTQAQHFYLLSTTKDEENVRYISIENITSDEQDTLTPEIVEEESVEQDARRVTEGSKKQTPKKTSSYESKRSRIPFLASVCVLLIGISLGSKYYLGHQYSLKNEQLTKAYDEYNKYAQMLANVQEQETKEVSYTTIDALNKLYSYDPKNIYVYYGDGQITIYCEVKKKSVRAQLITEMQSLGADVSYKGKLSDSFYSPGGDFNEQVENFNLKVDSAIIIQMEV